MTGSRARSDMLDQNPVPGYLLKAYGRPAQSAGNQRVTAASRARPRTRPDPTFSSVFVVLVNSSSLSVSALYIFVILSLLLLLPPPAVPLATLVSPRTCHGNTLPDVGRCHWRSPPGRVDAPQLSSCQIAVGLVNNTKRKKKVLRAAENRGSLRVHCSLQTRARARICSPVTFDPASASPACTPTIRASRLFLLCILRSPSSSTLFPSDKRVPSIVTYLTHSLSLSLSPLLTRSMWFVSIRLPSLSSA